MKPGGERSVKRLKKSLKGRSSIIHVRQADEELLLCYSWARYTGREIEGNGWKVKMRKSGAFGQPSVPRALPRK